MGIAIISWGAFSPIFGVITDKYGGNIAIFLGFLFFLLGIVFFYSGFNTGLYFIYTIGVLIGVGLRRNCNWYSSFSSCKTFSCF